ncbi:PadR family transcriptional regulator [Catenulispora sp. NL8]|uniref:PadR family transcriptional regulator n=1 Tax=Catenulispora pinistramenti TaxID=2705254 RepID=A0ABS5KSK8_9ACTN|nr:PadR family transcriptional regulator [Catenulispora pinistramenti]MBS2549033.1 PadR family transcriptional regulator [Catenulispora pinistramenti]
MSVKHSLLAGLADGERYGYQLRAEFEERTGATWPLNIGQVYTTLNRLERDGLVEPAGQDAANHVFYRITDAGREELFSWFARPVTRAERPRDELAVKLALAVTVGGVDVAAIVHAQRKHALAALQDYTRVKARLDPAELAASLVLESMIFQSEAEIRWLDHVEARVLRHARESQTTRVGGPADPGSAKGAGGAAPTDADASTRTSRSTRATATARKGKAI